METPGEILCVLTFSKPWVVDLVEKLVKWIESLSLWCREVCKALQGGSRGRLQRCAPHFPEMTCSILIQLVFCIKICLHHQSVTRQSLVVHPLLRKILDPPLTSNNRLFQLYAGPKRVAM